MYIYNILIDLLPKKKKIINLLLLLNKKIK